MAKVIFNNKNYNIDESALASAMAALEEHLRSMANGIPAGLYRTGSNYTELVMSWEELETSGAVKISESKKIDPSEMNEYGFYYGVPYSIPDTGFSLVFNEDGSGLVINSGNEFPLPAGTFIYGDHYIDMSAMGAPSAYTVSADGTVLQSEQDAFYLGSGLPEMSEYGFYYEIPYTTMSDTREDVLVFNKDGSILWTSGSMSNFTPAEYVTYGDHYAETEFDVYTFSADGSLVYLNDVEVPYCLDLSRRRYGSVEVMSMLEGDLVLPADGRVTNIPNNAFCDQQSLTSIVIPDSVVSIGSYAFDGCSNLKNVEIPNSVRIIGEEAFCNWASLPNVYISDIEAWCNIFFVGLPFNDLFNLYLNGEPVTDLTVPDTVSKINDYAFSNCNSLTSVHIGKNKRIEIYAFSNCINLANLVLEGSNDISKYAFSNCVSLTNVIVPEYEEGHDSHIGGYAFENCSSLTSVALPANLHNINGGVFSGCTSLIDITFNNTVAKWGYLSKGSKWNEGVPATYVQCIDGQVTL